MSEYLDDLKDRRNLWHESVKTSKRNFKISMTVFAASVALTAVGVLELIHGDTEGGIAAVTVGGLGSVGFSLETVEDFKAHADSSARLAVAHELIEQTERVCGKTL